MERLSTVEPMTVPNVYKNHALLNKSMLILSDCWAIFFSACIVYAIGGLRGTTVFPLGGGLGSVEEIARTFFLMGLGGAGILWFWGKLRHYTYRKPFWSELKEILQTIIALAFIDIASFAFAKQDFSRSEWLLLWGLIMFGIPLWRTLTKYSLAKLGLWQQPCVIIGCGDNALEAYHAIASDRLMGMTIVGFIAPETTPNANPLMDNVPVFTADDYWTKLFGQVKVYLALDIEQRDTRDQWLRQLSQRQGRNVSVIPSLRGVPLYGTDMSHFFSHEVMILRLRNNLARRSSHIVKRAFDLVVASGLLILLSPVFAYLVLKIRRDGGSATYGHERIGYNGQPFKCLKFRSMVTNSQEILQELLATDSQARAEWDKDFKLKNDPRITPIGQILRKTSLDELPQLWNVIKGEMSLVGPRPVVQAELVRYGQDVDYYLMVKPGMTGLWQVSGRSDTDYATRVYFDSWYVKNWSIWYDIAILFKTAKVVIARDGAY